MVPTCRDDPIVCIDMVALFIGEFLKDWTTLGMMALLLGLLFRLRDNKHKERELAYAQQMEIYEAKRALEQPLTSTWAVKGTPEPAAKRRDQPR